MFHRDLIKKINNGRCCILVGAGPSCEVGYPSWHELATRSYDKIRDMERASDAPSYERHLAQKKYPELFRQIERDLGDNRKALVNFIKPLLEPSRKTSGSLYAQITSWPFCCFLTTNYDDELKHHLSQSGDHYTVIRNRQEDFHHWRDGASNLIQKLHSDLNHPSEVILTSSDYQRIYSATDGSYYRKRLCTVFAMFDILIMGHSLSDPDLRWVLEVAKEMRSPERPIYMVAAEFTMAEELDLLEKYNIVLVSYNNTDGDHAELKRMLQTVDRFILPRKRLGLSRVVSSRPDDEVEAAVAIYLYRHLQGIHKTSYLSPLILFGLNSASDGELAETELGDMPVLTRITRGREQFADAITASVEDLGQQDLVSAVGGIIRITERGKEKVSEYRTVRATEREQAYGQFRLRLSEYCEGVTESQLRHCEGLAEQALMASFATRGSMVANKVFSDQAARAEELTDVFGHVTAKARGIENANLRLAFIDAVHEFLVEPTEPQRRYLASVSQGYFLYHLLGLDPRCGQTRREIFQNTLWLCDASVILPLIAKGCHVHDYSVELFGMFQAENAVLATTPNLLQEAWEHLEWARRLVNRFGVSSMQFQRAASAGGSYRQNLFIDGYINLNSIGEVGTFSDYLEMVLSGAAVDQRSFEGILVGNGLRIVNISDLKGFVQSDWGEIEAAQAEIQIAREERGIYRAPLQVESEAQVWVLVKNLRCGRYVIDGLENTDRTYFVSQSRIIDRVFDDENVTTWAPETVYRYVASLPGRQVRADLLQQCMLGEYYYAGIAFIDRYRYEEFFGQRIDSAKAQFEEQREGYVRDLEQGASEGIEESFERVPDLEKEYFVSQMAWQMADAAERRARLQAGRAAAAEARVTELEIERDRGWKRGRGIQEGQEIARLRNLQDPKHVRKRRRQAKRRRRKGR